MISAGRRFLPALCGLLVASSALASTPEIKILLDTDNNRASGCRVFTPASNYDGVEQIITTIYDDQLNRVESVTRQR